MSAFDCLLCFAAPQSVGASEVQWPLTITFLVAIVVTLYFAGKGLVYYGGQKDDKTFFLMGGRLSSSGASASHAAATMSLATVFYFFLAFGKDFGIGLLISPLTLVLGAWLFAKLLLPKLNELHFFSEPRPSTLAEFMRQLTGSRGVMYCIMGTTAIGMLSVVLIELFLGVSIFSMFFKQDLEASTHIEDWALVILMTVAFVYTSFGGLKAVVSTDISQFTLMFVAMSLFFVWILWGAIENPEQNISLASLAPADLPLNKGILLPYPLLVNMCIVNLLYAVCMLRTWLTIAAQPNLKEAERGIIGGAKRAAWVVVLLMLVGILVFRVQFPDVGEPNIRVLLDRLVELPIHESGNSGELPVPGNDSLDESAVQSTAGLWHNRVGSLVILPLFFAACLAALLSTVDSALLPILQTFFHDLKIGKPPNGNQRPFFHIPFATFLLMIIALGLYFIVFRVLNIRLESWLFTIFGFAITTGPVLIFTILLPKYYSSSRIFHFSIYLTIVGSLAIICTCSYLGNRNMNQDLVMWGSPLAIVFGCVIMTIGAMVIRQSQNMERT
ncbi:MAG: hypothetical protein O7G85_03670 [Planctomycetota bacterium]|nr:hypothetical protein [Planctomycetota bacterium]